MYLAIDPDSDLHQSLRDNTAVATLSWDEFKKHGEAKGMKEESILQNAAGFLHQAGEIIHFNDDGLTAV